jgi:hypothetical protein
MSNEKLSELSKPVAWTTQEELIDAGNGVAWVWLSERAIYGEFPLYSQEYVSALLARIEELEKKEAWRERQSVIDGLAGAGEAWSDIEEYMVKWDEERRNG